MVAHGGCLAVAVLLCLVSASSAYKDPALLSTTPKLLNLGLTFNSTVDGRHVVSNNSVPCTNDTYNSACLVHLSNDHGDSVRISWQANASLASSLPTPTTVTLKLCFSPYSSLDRAWRKKNDLIRKDKQCQTTIGKAPKLAEKLPFPSGNYSWKIPAKTPLSTIFIRAYAYCPGPEGSDVVCGYGQSAGYFQVDPIDSIPATLKHWVIGMSFVGPVCLAAYFVVDKLTKKNK